MPAFACQCVACRDPNGQHHANACSQTAAVASHSNDTLACINQSSTLMTLVVGESKAVVTCHKLLLAFHSGFFKVACYGNFQEAKADEMAMPEDDPEAMKAFINWCYTGRLDRSFNAMNPQKLWVFGDQLDAPAFKNAVMALICDKYYDGSYELTAKDAEYVFDNSLSDSLLNRFTNEQIRTRGPFWECTLDTVDEEDKEKVGVLSAWKELISMGGDLVTDHLDGFSRIRTSEERCREFLKLRAWLSFRLLNAFRLGRLRSSGALLELLFLSRNGRVMSLTEVRDSQYR